MKGNDEKYPEGHFIGMWLGIGIAIFSGMGVPLSIALKSPALIAIGPAIGLAFGLALGTSIEAKHKKEGKIRPLTEKEKKSRKILLWSVILIGIIGFVILLASVIK